MSHVDLRRFQSHSWLAFDNSFYTWTTFENFFSYFSLIILPPVILSCSWNWEKARREWQFCLGGKLTMVWGWRWGSFRKLTFFLSSSLGWNGSKKDSIPTVSALRQLHLDLMNKSFVFVQKGRGGVNHFLLALVKQCSEIKQNFPPLLKVNKEENFSTIFLKIEDVIF